MTRRNVSILLAATAGVLLLDLGSKEIADNLLSANETARIFPGLSLGHTRNEGVAFGMLAGRPLLVYTLVAASLAGLIVFYWVHARRPYSWLPTALLLGGAIGNLVDRLSLGYVRDFIDPAHWPAFNLADLAITFGVIGLFMLPGEPEPVGADD